MSDMLLSTREVCALFGRSSRTIRTWCRCGHLRPVRVGRAVFFRRRDVEALCDDPATIEQSETAKQTGS